MVMVAVQDRIHEAALRLYAERSTPKVTVSELAEAAGVARGTVYHHVGDIDALFEDVAERLVAEMDAQIAEVFPPTPWDDPALRIAGGIRFYIRRAQENPVWGRFLARYGASTPTLRAVLTGRARTDLLRGIELGRFQVRPDQIPSAIAALTGGVIAAISLVLDGYATWRDAGADTAELYLNALGVPADVAQSLVRNELPNPPPVTGRSKRRPSPPRGPGDDADVR